MFTKYVTAQDSAGVIKGQDSEVALRVMYGFTADVQIVGLRRVLMQCS